MRRHFLKQYYSIQTDAFKVIETERISIISILHNRSLSDTKGLILTCSWLVDIIGGDETSACLKCKFSLLNGQFLSAFNQEKLIIHQLDNTFPQLINLGILFTCNRDFILILLGEIKYWSILNIKEV